MNPPAAEFHPVAARWQSRLAALAYAAAGVACAAALHAHGRRALILPALAWFGACYLVFWSRAVPLRPPWMPRLADIAAGAVAIGTALAGVSAHRAGEDWRPWAVWALILLQMVRALVVNTPAEAETFLVTGLLLTLYTSTLVDWLTGTLLFAAFMSLWLAAMVFAYLLREIGKGLAAGVVVADEGAGGRVMRTGLLLSLICVGLGTGAFAILTDWVEGNAGPAAEKGGGAGPGEERRAAPGAVGGALPREGTLSFRGEGSAAPSPEALFRVRAPNRPTRFRLQAYDQYSARGWKNTGTETSLSFLTEGKAEFPDALGLGGVTMLPGEELEMEVTILPKDVTTLPTAERTVGVSGVFPGDLLRDREGALRTTLPPEPGFSYRLRCMRLDWKAVELDAAALPDRGALGERYWQLPDRLPDRVARQAQDWAGGDRSPWKRAFALVAGLRAGHAYQPELASPAGPRADPVDFFIFDAPAGNCLNFASALAVLARAAGVPSRLVIGYMGRRWDPERGEWVLRGMDGHAWCEIALDRIGWVPVDPTPPVQVGTETLGGSREPGPDNVALPSRQAPAPAPPPAAPARGGWTDRLLRSLAAQWPWLALAAASAWLGLNLIRGGGMPGRRTRRGRPRHGVERAFFRFCDTAAARGIEKGEAQTPLEFARTVSLTVPAAGGPALRLAELYTRADFSAEGPTREAAREAGELVRSLRPALAKPKR